MSRRDACSASGGRCGRGRGVGARASRAKRESRRASSRGTRRLGSWSSAGCARRDEGEAGTGVKGAWLRDIRFAQSRRRADERRHSTHSRKMPKFSLRMRRSRSCSTNSPVSSRSSSASRARCLPLSLARELPPVVLASAASPKSPSPATARASSRPSR